MSKIIDAASCNYFPPERVLKNSSGKPFKKMFYRLFVILLISFNLLSPEKANAQEPKICPCGFVTWNGVCPPCLQYKDGDGDGYGDPLVFINWDGGTLASGYVANKDDCNDKDNTIYPRAPELCDGKDNDCDLQVDEGFTDTDADGMADCIDPDDDNDGVADDLDCDDNNPNITTAKTWVLDYDNDGYYVGEPVNACTSPGEGYKIKVNQLEGDCEDGDASINPGATEIDCDGIDNNCDGDEGGGNCVECTGPTYYRDSDGDGFGNPNNFTQLFCDVSQAPDGYVENNLDCDDGEEDINPNTIWYKDADDDGYSDGTTKTQCTQPTDYKLASALIATSGVCDDGDADIHAGATWYLDADSDGYAASLVVSCTNPGDGYTATVLPLGDCNDSNEEINPATRWYIDVDNDGYPGTQTAVGCNRPQITYLIFLTSPGKLPSELISMAPDCDDFNAGSKPQTWYKDFDMDGFTDGTKIESCFGKPSPYYKLQFELSSPEQDCNDNNQLINPQTIWLKDADNDGYTNGEFLKQCAQPENYKLASLFAGKPFDCDDTEQSISPQTTWYKDADNDGYTDGTRKNQCLRPEGYKLLAELTNGVDCNDGDVDINPTTIWYKDVDNDGYSDGTTKTQCTQPVDYKLAADLTATNGDCNDEEAEVTLAIVWYLDADGDGYAASTTTSCTSPGSDYTTTVLPLGDCNDANAEINPATVWYQDRDNDGYPSNRTATGCARPLIYYGTWPFGGYTEGKLASELNGLTLDCDDTQASISPGTVWYKDADNDGFSDGTFLRACYQPSGYKRQGTVIPGGDCNDAEAAINPNTRWYPDVDNDGYSNGNYIVQCVRPEGFKLARELFSLVGDCNDNNTAINPATRWYKDADNDGYTDGTNLTQCIRPVGYKLLSELNFATDCNDAEAAINPATKWYKDADDDGYSDGTIKTQCTQPTGYKLAADLTATSGDCEDANPVLNPATVWYKDADDDGYGSGDVLVQCERPLLYKLSTELTSTFGDCSDLNPSINPGAVEICRNGIDDNCNGTIDEGTCEPCKNATALRTTNITSNSATLEWSAVTNPEQWQVQYKTNKKGSKWVDVFVTGNKRSVTITTLLSDQNYSWQIQAKCGKSWTGYSNAAAFKTTGGSASSVETKTYEIVTTQTFEVITAPNPSDSYFTLTVKSTNKTDRILVRVMDELGRVVEQKENVMSGTTVRFGDKYIPGIYFITVQQGKNLKSVKLVRR
jgi:hypothetical protein